MIEYCVIQYHNGKLISVVSGMGKNKGTWDSSHGRSSAYKHCADLNRHPESKIHGLTYKVERV